MPGHSSSGKIKTMLGTAATKAAAEIRGTVTNRSTRGRVLVVCLDRRAGQWLGRLAPLHGFFGGRCIDRRFQMMTVGAVVAVVVRRQFLKHEERVALVILNCIPSFGGKGSEL